MENKNKVLIKKRRRTQVLTSFNSLFIFRRLKKKEREREGKKEAVCKACFPGNKIIIILKNLLFFSLFVRPLAHVQSPVKKK